MSSFYGILKIEGEPDRPLLFAEQSIQKISDATGRANGKAGLPDVLVLAFECNGKEDFFYHHMFSPNSMIAGEVVFYQRDQMGILFKIEFANAYVLGLHVEYDHNNNMPLYMEIKIGWGISCYKGVIMEKYWNPNNPYEKATPITLQQKEPALLGYSFEDEEGEPIKKEKLKHNQTFYLIIKSENADGETTSINLDDDRLDFKYNGRIAKNDTLRGVPLTGDETRVELIAVRQKQQQNG